MALAVLCQSWSTAKTRPSSVADKTQPKIFNLNFKWTGWDWIGISERFVLLIKLGSIAITFKILALGMLHCQN